MYEVRVSLLPSRGATSVQRALWCALRSKRRATDVASRVAVCLTSRASQPGGMFGSMANMGQLMEQMKSAQADAAKLQAELATTTFEGFSSDETVKAVVDGSQARLSRVLRRPSAAAERTTRSPRGATSQKLQWNKARSASPCSSTKPTRMRARGA